jgi:predicted DsbA family dithiol-disulfide isomerase
MRKHWITLAMSALLLIAACKETPKPAGEQPAQPAAAQQPAAPQGTAAGAPGAKIPIELFVMSQCPYGVQVMTTMADVMKDIGDNVDVKFEFIGDDLGNGQFKSMHGDAEVQGNLLEICAQKLEPAKYMAFFSCLNKNYRQLPQGWEACATEAQIDQAKIKACFEGDEGKKLLAESFKTAKDKKATGSPTIFLAGERYSGGREKVDFLRVVCDKLSTKPQVCSTLPEPVKFTMTVISDKRCTECEARVQRMEGQLKGMFTGMTIAKTDYADPAGKELYTKTQVKFLPAFLFEKSVETDPGYGRLKRWMTPQGDFLSLNVGSKFDPAAEICDNKVDDTGDGKIDCDDDTCKNTLECRTEIPKKLEVFIMSGCPFGIKALDAMKEVLEAFKDDKITFEVHYIATENGDGTFQSLHGQWEVDENIRELCAFKHGGLQKGMEYAWCRNPNIRDAAGWKDCATKAKLDVAKVEACSTGAEGKKLHSDDIKIANGMGISASPTWLANNKSKFSGVDAERIKQSLCQNNKDLKGCGKTLSTDSKVQGSCG